MGAHLSGTLYYTFAFEKLFISALLVYMYLASDYDTLLFVQLIRLRYYCMNNIEAKTKQGWTNLASSPNIGLLFHFSARLPVIQHFISIIILEDNTSSVTMDKFHNKDL